MSASCRSARAPEPVKLTIFGLGLETGQHLRQDALEEFTKTTGVHVDVIPTLGTSSDQLRLALRLLHRASATPDVFVIDVIWPGAMQEHLLDLRPYMTEESRQHIPALLENDTIGNRIVALPFYLNSGMLFFRRDLLAKYGYSDPPATWKQLREMALRIQQGERRAGRQNFWGYLWQGAAYEGLTCNALEWQSSFGGGPIIESDGKVSINNPRSGQALAAAAAWVNTISPASVLSYMESDSLKSFQAGNAAFLRYWSSGYRGLSTSMGAGSIGIALLPSGPNGRAQSVGGFHLGISRYSRHPREAASLVLYLTGRQVQKRRALQRGYLPTRPDLYKDPELARVLPQLLLFQAAAPESWIARPSSVAREKYADVSKIYYEGVHRTLTGERKPAAALQEMEQDIIRLTQHNGAARN